MFIRIECFYNILKMKILLSFISIALFCCSCSDPVIERVTSPDEVASVYSGFSDVAELGTVEYTIKQVIRGKSHTKIGDKSIGSVGEKSILFGWMAYVKAGIDLNEFSENDIEIDEKTQSVYVTLPHAKILSINIPPDSIKEIYHREGMLSGKFDPMERDRVLDEGQDRLGEIIKTLSIQSEAESNTKLLFEDMLAHMGFDRQNIHVRFGKEDDFEVKMTSKTEEL